MNDHTSRQTNRRDETDRQNGARTTGRREFVKALGAGAVVAPFASTALGTGAALPGDPTPALHRDGNVMRDPSDNLVALHGLNVIDPRRANANAPWTKPIDEAIRLATNPDQGWNAQVIRLPVHPIDVHDPADDYGELAPGEFTQAELETYIAEHLDPAVQACKDRGVYAIVDYHRHRTTDFTTAALDQEVRTFWETVAPKYAEDEHVIYEVYNEPVGTNRGSYGEQSAEEAFLRWRDTAQPWVDVIQDEAPERPVIVGSPSWSQYTYLAPDNEFEGDNLMYAGHVYAQDYLRPLGDSFGTPAEEVPVFMTEWGFDSTGGGASHINGTVGTEGQQFESFFEEHDHVHSTAWVLSHFWTPSMVNENYEVSTAYGEFVQDFLVSKKGVHRPTGEGSTTTTTTTTTDDPMTTTEGPSGTPGRVGDNTALPNDPDADGLYEDVNGNGRQDIADAVDLFQNQDSVDAGFFDFNDSGEMEIGDAVELFRENTQ